MKCLLLAVVVLASLAASSSSAATKPVSYIFETRVLSGKDIERVKISFDVLVKGPKFSYKTDLDGKPFGWFTGYKFYYLKKTNEALFDATEYTVKYTTFDDEVSDPEISISDVAIVEPDKREPKNVRFCVTGKKNTDKTKLEPNTPITLTKCN